MKHMECIFNDNNKIVYINPETMDKFEVDYSSCGENFIVFSLQTLPAEIAYYNGDYYLYESWRYPHETYIEEDLTYIGNDYDGFYVYVNEWNNMTARVKEKLPTIDELMTSIRTELLLIY